MKIIIIILQAILNLVRKRRDLIANTDKIPPAIKKSIIAWYSPKKQKLNNYDVIESYAEDFTRWRIDNTGVTTTQKKITIAANTELKNIPIYLVVLLLVTAKLRLEFQALTRILFLKLPTLTISKVV